MRKVQPVFILKRMLRKKEMSSVYPCSWQNSNSQLQACCVDISRRMASVHLTLFCSPIYVCVCLVY